RLLVEVKLVLARGIREVSDGLAIGAPTGIALGNTGSAGQIARVTFFAGDGEDFAMCFNHCASTGRRELYVVNLIGAKCGAMRFKVSQLAVNLNRDWLIGSF